MRKKILYLDMDGVIADFDKAIKSFCPDLHTSDEYPDYEARSGMVNAICEANPDIFHSLQPIDGAIAAVKILFELYDVYFLSTPMWNVPMSFTGKRIWIGEHFGQMAEMRLILTHRKDLAIGHYLVDDRLRNGAAEFTGLHIHFGQPPFENWEKTLSYFELVSSH